MNTRRVVITGIGAITPLGLSMAETWAGLLAGRSGCGPITRFTESGLAVKVACEVKGFSAEAYMDARSARRSDLFEQYAVGAAVQALRDAELVIVPELAAVTGVVVGSAVGGFDTMLRQAELLRERGQRALSPFSIPMIITNGATAAVSIHVGAHGPSFSPVSACATGNDSIGQAAELIRRGAATIMLAGGADAPVSFFGIASFDQLGAVSHAGLPRPCDKARDGVVIGEGACVLVLEDLEFALARGARILAELVGYGQTTDGSHPIAPVQTGEHAARAMTLALAQAGVAPNEIGYINAHGTATPLNDTSETAAIKLALGDAARTVPISSTKSMTGHMMGATAALEAAICVMAIRDGMIPPTMNLTDPDPLCDLDYTPNAARAARVDVAVNNAFGFGGHNSVTVIRRYVDHG